MTARDDTWFSDDATNPGKKRPRPRAVPADASPLAETILGVRAKLLVSSSGSPRKTPANATTIFALDPRWNGVLAYHALGDRVVKLKAPEWHDDDRPANVDPGPWTDADTTRAQAWLAREYSLDLGADTLGSAVWAAAERTVIDPLRDYFEPLRGTWDGVERVDTWLSGALGAVDTAYTRAIGRRWLISAVARALRPGVKVDCVLVLEGPQGVRKSTALATLCPNPGLFFDDDLQIGDKDAAQSLRGKWICELGELAALSRHELGTLKAFVTRGTDTYRPSFGRTARDFPRRTVFAASTNESEYLKDPTGNRRWWPVRVAVVRPIDIEALSAYRDQLWAEALQLLEAGAPHYVDTPELAALCSTEQTQREQGDPWEEHVAAYLAGLLAKAGSPGDEHPAACECVRCRGVTVSAVLTSSIGLQRDKQGRGEEMRAGVILRGLGWTKGERQRQEGGRVRPYFPPGRDGR
jgi:predicted P-loop ATPase